MTALLVGAHVAVFTLGGTIASTPAATGIVPALDADALIRGLGPGLNGVRVTGHAFRRLPSPHLGLADIVGLARTVSSAVADGADGVVVTHGTDTLEESAYALDLLLDLEVPVVLTGALRGPTAVSPDGPANLRDAITVAIDPAARSRGVLVALNQEVHAARWVTKAHVSRPDAFASPGAGPLGEVTEGRVRWFWRPEPRPHVALGVAAIPRVPMITACLGDDATVPEAVLAADIDGLVVEGLGAGHVPPAWIGPLTAGARAIPVVLASRTGCGEMLQQTYGYPGGEVDLLGGGLLWSGALGARRARILLTLGLAAGWSRERIRAALTEDTEEERHGRTGA